MTAPRVGLEWPPGWTRPWAEGWLAFLGLVLFGVLITAMAWTAAAEREISTMLAFGGFGLALLGVAPLFFPARRRRQPMLEPVTFAEGTEPGVVFSYSPVLACLCLPAALFMSVAGAGLAANGAVVPGVLCAVVFIAFTVLGLRSIGHRWRITLTPTDVVVDYGGLGRVVAPWSAIKRIVATEVTTRGTHQPLIGLDVAATDMVETGRLSRTMLRANAMLGFPGVCLSIRTLSADPLLLYHTFQHYHLHPETRAELASMTGLARIRSGDFG